MILGTNPIQIPLAIHPPEAPTNTYIRTYYLDILNAMTSFSWRIKLTQNQYRSSFSKNILHIILDHEELGQCDNQFQEHCYDTNKISSWKQNESHRYSPVFYPMMMVRLVLLQTPLLTPREEKDQS